ncbi:MAG TPA: type II secretion system F family protein [Dehalococcoidia bacterium]|nr:type II secretion system F family protein [Dehalococcoidia bacterium]
MVMIAAFCAAIAVGTFLFAVLVGSAPATQRRLDSLVAGRIEAATYRGSDDDGPSRGMLLRGRLRQVMPSSMLDKLAALLVQTGIQAPPETVAAIWAGVALGPVALYLVVSGGLPQGEAALLPLALVGLGGYVPLMVLRSRARARRKKILLSLPDAMDLLTTCVEAGLGIDAAVARVAEKAKEPLAEELRIVLRTMAMGGTRRDALTQLASRVGLPEIQSFTSAIIQAEMMGVSLGQVLRVQSEALRVARKQRAEQQAYKAPVKIIIVLALFIFPSMFIVILGPAAISLMNSGFGG